MRKVRFVWLVGRLVVVTGETARRRFDLEAASFYVLALLTYFSFSSIVKKEIMSLTQSF